MPPVKYLIVNADDLGAGIGINRGVLEAFEHGIVTSTSLMVDMPASEDAAAMLAGAPALSPGLHVTLTSETGELLGDVQACRGELEHQLERFERLIGRRPTHLDSHHNIHYDPRLRDAFASFADELGLPLRGHSPAVYYADFYGQWDDGETHVEEVSVESLVGVLERDLAPCVTELGCHPGYLSGDFQSSYSLEREAELRTLCDPAVRACLERLQIPLVSFADLPGIAPD